MGSLDGKVAFITGVARGQGRAHAVRLATEGADIIGIDICADLESMDYPNASVEDLSETKRLVEATGRRMVARQADVRYYDQVEAAFNEGVAEFGRIDIVLANAGVIRLASEANPQLEWDEILGTNLTGVWNACRVSIPKMIEGGNGGSIVMTSSTAGLKAPATMLAGGQAYSASKHGMVGLMRTWARELAQYSIRVNTIHPTGVVSGMTMNETMQAMMADPEALTASMQNALPIEILQADDISDFVEFLVSERGRYITGQTLGVDAGFLVR
ncbi:MAG: mycofactocin-coupled SDR family oxidoreductase [Actinomycetota bacterium]|nr:mycofactocin-coupled SDR family oxidoreductase [Actinomycetota bacterium]